MREQTRIKWQGVIKQQLDSGLSIQAFCRQHKITPSNFYKYRTALSESTESEPGQRFVKLEQADAISTGKMIHLRYGETQLSITHEVSPVWLAGLLKALA